MSNTSVANGTNECTFLNFRSKAFAACLWVCTEQCERLIVLYVKHYICRVAYSESYKLARQ